MDIAGSSNPKNLSTTAPQHHHAKLIPVDQLVDNAGSSNPKNLSTTAPQHHQAALADYAPRQNIQSLTPSQTTSAARTHATDGARHVANP
jgi:hypothetical protein